MIAESAPLVMNVITFGVIGVGVVGLVAAIIARSAVADEKKMLNRAIALLEKLGLPSVEELDKKRPEKWLVSSSLDPNSHVGEAIVAVWRGWQNGMIPRLSDLRSLASARERRRFSGQLAGGIVALLVVLGIFGTLFAVHTVLMDFKIEGKPAGGEDATVIKVEVMKLIQTLGHSFSPSLCALGLTLVVAVMRGWYHKAAISLGSELDRFAITSIFPNFPERPLGDRFFEYQTEIAELVTRMNERDEKLDTVVSNLEESAVNWNNAGVQMKTAGNSVVSATTELKAQFQKDSSLIQALQGITDSVLEIRKFVDVLKVSREDLEANTAEGIAAMDSSVKAIQSESQRIPGKIEEGCRAGTEVLGKAVEESFDGAVESLNTAVETMSIKVENHSQRIVTNFQAATDKVMTNANATTKGVVEGLKNSRSQMEETLVAGASMVQGAMAHGAAEIEGGARRAGEAAAQSLKEPVAGLVIAADSITTSNNQLQGNVQALAHNAEVKMDATLKQAASKFNGEIGAVSEEIRRAEQSVSLAAKEANGVACTTRNVATEFKAVATELKEVAHEFRDVSDEARNELARIAPKKSLFKRIRGKLNIFGRGKRARKSK